MITIGFTGHRPDKLGGYNWYADKNIEIRDVLWQKVCEVISDYKNNNNINEFHFVTGGALGIDQFAFDIVSEAQAFINSYKITTEIAVPFKNQPIKWHQEDIDRYYNQLQDADKVTYVDTLDNYKIKGYEEGKYYPAKMQKRNEYMVDISDIIIAVWDGSKGGTYNCIQYAKKQNKKIIVINPKKVLI